METSNNGSTVSQPSSSCLKMREIIDVINEYQKSRTESSALLINKFLQVYSVTIDVSVFEPDSNLGAQFYVSLHKLFSNVDPQSKMAWNCVDVLCNACRNSSAKQALIETYQFVPILSRMLLDQLDIVNKKKLLILLQDLTCGIKLTFQISHLPNLFKTLTKWVEDDNQDIVCLSLSVILNLCIKNMCAVYTLARVVDIKKLLRFCLPLQGPFVEVHVCKLMIILNHLYDDMLPRKSLLNLVTPTFNSIHESLTKNDSIMLRSTVDFFSDMIKNENIEIFKEYTHYIENLDDLLTLINSRKTLDPDATPLPPYDPECMTHILKFIYTIEFHKLADLSPLYKKILKYTLEWMKSEKSTYQANILLTTITQNLSETDDSKNVLKLLASKLPMLLNILQSTSTPVNLDGCKRLASLLQLLRMMLKSSAISESVLSAFKQELLMNIFSPVLSDDLNAGDVPRLKMNEDSTTTTAYVDAYIYAVSLVYEVAQYDARWLDMLSMLMESRNIQTLLGLALYGSDSKVKQLVLELSKSSRFPIAKVAASMAHQNIFIGNSDVSNRCNSATFAPPIYPVLGYSQIEMFDDTLKSLKCLIQEQNITNDAFNQATELYEHRVATMSHAELSASNALQAATDRCISLQHRLALLSTHHNKLEQVIHNHEKRQEKNEKAMKDLNNYCVENKRNFDAEIANRDKLISEREKTIEDTKTELLQVSEQKQSLEEQLTKCENLIKKLEENGNKVEKKLETREQQLKNANSHIDGLNQQNKELRKMLDQKESKLAEVTKHYLATKEVLDTITKMAASQTNHNP